jgi:metal-responsive CopG/Arc/MetJ family transcriptional regulator
MASQPSKPATRKVTISIPKELDTALREISMERAISKSRLIAAFLHEIAEQNGKGKRFTSSKKAKRE